MSVPFPESWSDAAQSRHLRRNYLALAFDGGFYAAGTAFVAFESVLPTLIEELGGPNWLVALAPTLNQYGFFILPMFTAHWYERLTRFKPTVAWISVPQRMPPLVVGLALVVGLLVLRSYVYVPLLGDDTAVIHDAGSLPGSLHICGRTWHKDSLGRQQTGEALTALYQLPPIVVDPRQFAPCPAGACGASPGSACATVIFARVGADAYLGYSLSGGP